jgi:hypothetical protein
MGVNFKYILSLQTVFQPPHSRRRETAITIKNKNAIFNAHGGNVLTGTLAKREGWYKLPRLLSTCRDEQKNLDKA